MISSDYSFEQMLPSYLTNTAKGRIKDALEQFFGDKENINYDDFYTQEHHDFLMQSDMMHSVIALDWNSGNRTYDTGYSPAILISNSCDVTLENNRSINNKEALFAPIISVENYLNFAKARGSSTPQLETFYTTLKKQEYTNLFYLPANPLNKQEYIVRLDKIYWLPRNELVETVKDLKNQRFASLSDWGYYLYLTKLSLHICRVPEEIERRTTYI